MTGPTGSSGVTGPTGSTGPMPTDYAITGANTFYGSQTFVGGTAGTLILDGYASLDFPDDPSAAIGGVPLGGIYHDNGSLKIRIS